MDSCERGVVIDTHRVRSEGSDSLEELIHFVARLWPHDQEEDQGLAEYALILGLIAIVAILSLIFLGDTLADLLSYIGDTIDANT